MRYFKVNLAQTSTNETDVKITDRWEMHLGKIIHLDNKHLNG